MYERIDAVKKESTGEYVNFTFKHYETLDEVRKDFKDSDLVQMVNTNVYNVAQMDARLN